MQKGSTIVLYGYDQMLTYTRVAILRGAGFNALSATSLNDLIALITSRSPDLLLFCQTIDPSEQAHLKLIVRKLQPKIVTMSMDDIVTTSHHNQGSPVRTTFVSGHDFLHVIENLLQKQAS